MDSLLIRQNISLGGPIEVAEVEAQVTEIDENSRNVRVDCPDSLRTMIEQNGEKYKIELKIEAFSLGTVRHSIGNFLFQEWDAYSWEFTSENVPEIDVTLHYDSNTFITGQSSAFELDVYGIKVSYTNYILI